MVIDFEHTYSNLGEEGKRKDRLSAIQTFFAVIELLIENLASSYIKKSDPDQNIESLSNFKRRIDYLKSKKVIGPELWHNLNILREIRNEKFHTIAIPKTSKSVYSKLENVKCNNDFVNSIPNDSRKYQLVGSYCCACIFEIMEKISPEEITHLEMAEDTKFESIDD